MELTWFEVVVWLVVGAVAGWATSALVTRKKEGFGRWANLGVGLVGALLGGFIFKGLGIDLGLEDLKITLQDLIAAFVGSFLVIGVVAWFKKRRKGRLPEHES